MGPNAKNGRTTVVLTLEQKRKLVRMAREQGRDMVDVIGELVDHAPPSRVTTGTTRRRDRA